MRRAKNPRQNRLFDPYMAALSDPAYARLKDGWHHVFRTVILACLERPVSELGKHFSPDLGRPTKEMYSIAGLLLIKEFMNWTCEQAVHAYLYDQAIQYSLNLDVRDQVLCERTLLRYEKIFAEEELAGMVMEDVTSQLVKMLELDLSLQRVDSTHVLSDMANMGRTRMMGVTIKRFLTQLGRHDPAAWQQVPGELRERYETCEARLFGKVSGQETRSRLRRQVAQDMHWLVERFADVASMKNRTTYKRLVDVFHQQCDVVTDKTRVAGQEPAAEEPAAQEPAGEEPAGVRVEPKAKTGGNVIQNPSDPDATFDGHKGPGYKVQIAETCSPQNDVQLITLAMPQTAVAADANALAAVMEELKERSLMPKTVPADTSYGSDENVQWCAEQGVELVSPSPGATRDGTDSKANRLADFEVDAQTGQVTACPAGHAPLHSAHDSEKGKTHVAMAGALCEACALLASCPVQPHRGRYVVHFTDKRRRLAERRVAEQTPQFKDVYRLRSGIESANSALKRRHGLKRLRVRGRGAVFHAIAMRCAGRNILRAASSEKLRTKVAAMAAQAAPLGHKTAPTGLLGALLSLIVVVVRHFIALAGILMPGRPAAAPTMRLQAA